MHILVLLVLTLTLTLTFTTTSNTRLRSPMSKEPPSTVITRPTRGLPIPLGKNFVHFCSFAVSIDALMTPALAATPATVTGTAIPIDWIFSFFTAPCPAISWLIRELAKTDTSGSQAKEAIAASSAAVWISSGDYKRNVELGNGSMDSNPP